MLNKLKDTLKTSIFYGIGNIAAKLVGFILVPLYIKELSLEDFGILSLLEVVVQLLIPIMGFAVYQSLSRWYWDKESKDIQGQVFKTSFIIVFIISTFLLILLVLLSKHLTLLIFEDIKFTKVFILVLFSAYLQVLNNIPFTLIRLKEQAGIYSLLNVFKLVINLTLIILFVVRYQRGIQGIFEAQIIGSSIIGIVFIILFGKTLTQERLNKKIIKPLINFGLPLVFSSVSSVILAISDRFCLRYVLGFESVGVYALGFKISSVIKLILLTSFQMAIVPIIYKASNEPGFQRFLSKLNTYLILVIAYFSLILGMFSEELSLLISNKNIFVANYSYLIVPILNFAIMFDQIRYNISFGLNIAKKTKVLSLIVVAMSILNIGLNLVLIKLMGTIGAAISTLLTQMVYVVVNYKVTNRFFKIKIETGNVIRLSIFYVIFISTIPLISDFTIASKIFIKLGLIILFPIVLYAIWPLEEIEKKRIVEFVSKLRIRKNNVPGHKL